MVLVGVLVAVVGLYFLLRLTVGHTRSQRCLVGKTAIITGASSGIGYQVALNLASRGCRIIIADIADSEDARARIIEETDNRNIVAKRLDLASIKSVRQFAQAINLSENRLDILINNAGIGASSQERTADGLQPIMQTNSFGPFLLCHLLLGLLRKSAPSRIIFTSSFMAYFHKLRLTNLNYATGRGDFFSNSVIYANSSLCNIILADAFAEKLRNTGVVCNSINPGLTRSENFFKSFSTLKQSTPLIFVNLWNFIMWVYGKNGWEGAQTTLYLAVDKRLGNVTGQHFWDCKAFPKPLLTRNKQFCQQIWLKCEDLVDLAPNERLQ